MALNRAFLELLQHIEQDIFAFYGLEDAPSCTAHVLTAAEAAELVDTPASDRGQLLLVNEQQPEEIFLGLTFGEDIINTCLANDPRTALHYANLDAFCVLVEEVSHFHLVAQRAQQSRGVSQLELEWQGEIDKLLLSAKQLRLQSGDAHLLPLARTLFDRARILPHVDQDRYWVATKNAARLWYELITYEANLADPFHSHDLRVLLRQTYWSDWQQKLRIIEARRAA